MLFSKERQARIAGCNMGANNFVASYFWGTEPYLITIGSNCQITSGVQLLTHGGGAAVRNLFPNFDCFGKIEIGNYVYLGMNALVMPGCCIGDNVIVAAGSVVTKSIPSRVVVAGNPAKIICSIDDYVEKNKKFNLNTKNLSQKQKKKVLLNVADEMFVKKSMVNYDNK